ARGSESAAVVRAVHAHRKHGARDDRHGPRPHVDQALRRAPRRPHLGREPRRPGFHVPLHAACDPAARGRTGDGMTAARPKILYVEDNPDNRMLVRSVLAPAGYTVVEAADGLSGIEAAL